MSDENLIDEGIIKEDPFWGDDITILFNQDRLIEFFPTEDMTDAERLNAISRFSIYVSLILILYTGRIYPIYIALFVLGACMFVYDQSGTKNKLESFTDKINNIMAGIVPGYGDVTSRDQPGISGTVREEIRKKRAQELGPEPVVRIDEEGNVCTPPTDNNPFMNVLVPEYYENPKRPEACQLEGELPGEEGVAKEANEKFEINLYKDVADIWDKNNSQRQFYTMPNTTIPNDQSGFAHWLYGNAASCKDSRYDCHGDFNDPRRKRFIFPNNEVNPVTTKKQESGLVLGDQQQVSA